MEDADDSKARQPSERKPSTAGPEMACPGKRPKYSKMSGFATTAGQEFEMHLIALVFLRARNGGLRFQLGSNVKGAGALDDLVFRCETRQAPGHWQTIFVQLKHKDDSWVKRCMLAGASGNFSMPSYFKSYLEIKKAMATKKETLLDGSFAESQFVLFTNAKGNVDLGETFAGNLSLVEECVWFGSGSVYSFETDQEMLKCLGESSHDGIQFLNRFRLFCGQPNASELKEAVKEELLKLDAKTTSGLDIDRLCDCYLANVKVWYESRSTRNDILDNDHDILDTAIDKVRLESCSEQTLQTHRLELEFEQAGASPSGAGPSPSGAGASPSDAGPSPSGAGPFPSGAGASPSDAGASPSGAGATPSGAGATPSGAGASPSDAGPSPPGAGPSPSGSGLSVVRCSAGAWRLSLTKLVQASRGRCLVLTCRQLLDNKRALLAARGNGDGKRLVVCTRDWRSELADPCFEVIAQMLDIGDSCSVRDIVFLQDGNSSVGRELTLVFPGRCQSSTDEFDVSLLTVESRDKLFGKAVNLQGVDTTLIELFSNDRLKASQVLDASLVAAILGTAGSLTVGSALPEGIGYFVERTLEWVCVKASVFHDLRGTVTIRVQQNDASATTFMDKALDFVRSIKDSPSFSQENKEDVVNKLSRSQRVPDKDNGAVYVGPKFSLGFYECNCVGLRFGRDNAVTALRVCPSKDALENTSFLIVSDKINEDDARSLSQFHKSQHLLLLTDGQLRWIQSHGDIEFVRRHFDEDRVVELKPATATDVSDRLVLVCAEPGMGKSTLMTRLARNTKEALPHYFVISLAMNDHTKLFSEGKHRDALGFLSSASMMVSPLERALLRHALEVSGNVFVIADGFDEIAPKYVEHCCELLSSLLGKTKASKIWMTSRNSIQSTLEAHFSKFSARLRKFYENDQKEFLKKFWAENSNLKLSMEELDKFIDTLLVKTFQAVRDQEKFFMGIPLQTMILAEVFDAYVTGSAEKSELPVKLDLLMLIEMFVDKKFRVYLEVKLSLQPHTTTYEMCYEIHEKTFFDNHSSAALSVILDDDDLKTLGMERVIRESSAFCETISSGKDKTGFVVDVVNGKPRFIHRVFAEFFVAKWISENLTESAELIKSKLFTVDFGVVRTIVDRILARDLPLHNAVLNEDMDQMRTLLGQDTEQVRTLLGQDPEQVRTLLERQVELVEAKDGGGRTALHLAAGLGTSKNRKENVRRGEILDLLIGKTSDFHLVDGILGVSPLRYADITQSWVAIDKLLRKCEHNEQLLVTLADVKHKVMHRAIFVLDLDRLLGFCLDHGLAVEHGTNLGRLLVRACNKGSLNVATLLIGRNADINFINGERRSPLASASFGGHLDIVKLLYEKLANSRLHGDNTGAANIPSASEYTNQKNEAGETAMHHAAIAGQSPALTFLISQGGDAASRDHGNGTPLRSAAKSNQPSALRILLEAVDEADRAAAVNSCDDQGDSVLMCAAELGSVECVELLVQAGAMLSQVGRKGETPLMTAAREGKQEVVEWMLQNFNAEREDISKLAFINIEGNDGNTAMLHAVWGDSVKCIELLVQAGAKLTQVGRDGETPLITAAREGKLEVVNWMLHNFNAEREDISKLAFINIEGNDGNTAMLHALWGGFVKCVELLVQAGAKLSQVDRDGETPLITAASKVKLEVVKWMLHNFNAVKEEMSLQEFIAMQNKRGKTALHNAVLRGSVECVELLVQAGAKLSQVVRDGGTPLGIAAKSNNQEVLKWMLHNFNAVKEDLSLQEFFSMKDKNGNTAMCNAAEICSVEYVELLVQAGAKLSQVGRRDETPLMKAARQGKQEVVEWMLHNYDAVQEDLSLQEFILMKNIYCHTAIHSAAEGGSVECVELLVQAGAKLSQVGGYGETPLMAAARSCEHEVVKWMLHNFDADREGTSLQEFINMKYIDGFTAMHTTAGEGFVECVELLVQAGAKLSQGGPYGKTPLMAAAQKGKQEVVKWMLHNFDALKEDMSLQEFVAMKNNYGHIAMHYAAAKGFVECVELLVQAGAKLSEVDRDGETPFMRAAREGKQEVEKWMLHNFDALKEDMSFQEFVAMKNKDGDTTMHFAARGGSVECVDLLVQAGAKLSQVNRDGETPLIQAARQGKQEVVEWMLHNFDAVKEGMSLQELVHMEDKDGDTTMHFAARGGSVECVELLVQAGAKLSQVGRDGETPLMAAARRGKHEVLKWMLHNFDANREGMSRQEFLYIKDKNGNTAKHSVDKFNRLRSLSVLLEAVDEADRADFVNSCNNQGDSVLMCAVRHYEDDDESEDESEGGFVECVALLVQAGAKLSQVGRDGETPLMVAARRGKQEDVKWMLHNFNANREGMSLLEFIFMEDKFGVTASGKAFGECINVIDNMVDSLFAD